MNITWHRCKTCGKAIQATLVASPTCPLCGDETVRVDSESVNKFETCLFVGPAPKPAERSAFSATIAEMGRDAEWIKAATLAVSDGRLSPGEARGLLVSLRRHYAAARPLVEALADLAGEGQEPALVRPQVPVDLDDLDSVGDADRFPPPDEGRPATQKEAMIIWRIMVVGAAFFAGLLAIAWIFRGSLSSVVW